MRTFIENGYYLIETTEYKIKVRFIRYVGDHNALCEAVKIMWSTLPCTYIYEGAKYTWNISLLKLIARRKQR